MYQLASLQSIYDTLIHLLCKNIKIEKSFSISILLTISDCFNHFSQFFYFDLNCLVQLSKYIPKHFASFKIGIVSIIAQLSIFRVSPNQILRNLNVKIHIRAKQIYRRIDLYFIVVNCEIDNVETSSIYYKGRGMSLFFS